jgi:hypothetical protein
MTLVAVTLALVALNAWWYTSQRRGFALFNDEAGYTTFAIDQARALQQSGVHALVTAVEQQSVHGPLVPLVTVPFELVFGANIGNGFAVVLVFYALLVAATYALGRRLMSDWFAALAAIVVATAPEILTFTRMYYFAVPAAAAFTAAAWAFLRSDRLDRTGWAVAGGALLGIGLLTRTLVLALAPGLLLAALVHAIGAGDDVTRRLRNLCGAAAAMVAVAATWYARNLGDAVAYLRGTRFRPPGSDADPYHAVAVLRELRLAVDTTYLPVAAVLGIVVLAAAAVTLRRRRPPPTANSRRDWWRVLASPGAFLGLALVEAVVVFLVSDTTEGKWLVVLPLVVVLALATMARLPRLWQVAASAVLVVLCVFNVLMMSAVPGLGTPRGIDVASMGPLTVTDGRQFLQQHFPSTVAGAPGHLPATLRRVNATAREVTDRIRRATAGVGQRPVVFAAQPQSAFLNVNDILLADRLLEDHASVLGGAVDLAPAASVAAYCARLDNPKFGLPNVVLTHRPTTLHDQRAARVPSPPESRLAALGFRVLQVVNGPDGPTSVWFRSQAAAPRRCPG